MPLRPRFADFASAAHFVRSARFARIAIAAIGIAILAFSAWDSGRRGLANWLAMRARDDLRVVTQGRPSVEQWQRTVDGLHEALRLAPRDPNLWDYLALAYEAGQRHFYPGGANNVYTEYALIHFRQEASLRPTWPHAWVRVALMKYQLRQLDDELSWALYLSMRLGPWEPGVQLIAADIGLALWDRMDQPFKDLVRDNLRRAAVKQAGALVQFATKHGKWDVLCQASLDAVKNRLKCPQQLSSR